MGCHSEWCRAKWHFWRPMIFYTRRNGKGKGKAVPLQAWTGTKGSRKLRFLDFMTTAQDGGKVVSLTHRPCVTVMAHGDAGEGKWRGNWRMEWVASTLHTTSEHGVSSITTADAHTSAASSRVNWRPPADLNGLVRFAERRNLVSARVPSHFNWPLLTVSLQDSRLQLKCDGTRWRTGGEVKWKLANEVCSQYSSHYLGTWFTQHYYRWFAHLGCSSSRLNWRPPGRFKWTRPIRRKTKSGFCACAVTFQTQSATSYDESASYIFRF